MQNRHSSSAWIGDGVELGRDVRIGPGAVVMGPCVIGDSVFIGPGALIGGPPEISSLEQTAAWHGELGGAGIVIGDGAVIREGAVITQGSHRTTTVGPGAWLLSRCYVAHDVVIGAGATVSAGVSIGGHAEIGAGANLGMNASVHQRRRVGPGAMVGMCTPLSRDVPPFAKVFGTPPRLHAANRFALARLGIDPVVIERVETALLHGGHPYEGIPELAEANAWWSAAESSSWVRPAVG
ncbi:acyl-ACP--UDP-N- acetylglucosamine O-acyltransferase [Schumannella sp. 10F1B-5-1]|uniref:acyl-ACP--UDP-N- acetylglucosamine O-acyltransferase n=1 Tax=Schumannella sp. 10F1B-5-1 TaxID=2590780 RepID=UPI002102A771|nr:acyl-ACP--UDP-N- acetylglucosamine O-acyltransferase [Schumannella sp. 10F1B-5-1]